MNLLGLIASILNTLVLLYVLVLLGRLVLDYIPLFNRSWRPKGAGLVVAEVVYTVTDPPLKMFRKVIPPLRVGPLALDFGFALTMLLCFLLLGVTRSLGAA